MTKKCLSSALPGNPSFVTFGISHKYKKLGYPINIKSWDIPTPRIPPKNLGISQDFRSPQFATNRDTFNYIQLIRHRFCKWTIGTLFATYLQHPKQKISSDLRLFSNRSCAYIFQNYFFVYNKQLVNVKLLNIRALIIICRHQSRNNRFCSANHPLLSFHLHE